MAIWHGYGGGIRLQRAKAGPAYVWIEPGDVDAAAKRMSADRAVSSLITGDLIAIAHVDDEGAPLSSVLPFMNAGAWEDGQAYNDGQWYANVDPIGGLRLYRRWRDALAGGIENAMPMDTMSARCRVSVRIVADNQRCLAQTVSWDLNTDRDVVDITSLGEGFKKNMSTLVSGSGKLDCFFTAGNDACVQDRSEHEKSMYLHQLVLRQEIGASFEGIFMLKRRGNVQQGLSVEYDQLELFYKCNCVISNVASSVNVDDAIHSRIEFVTTDQIQLLYDYPISYLLQEGLDKDKVLQESESGILVDLPI